MSYIRVNKLLRYSDLTIEELSGLLGEKVVLNPNTRLGVYREEQSIDYNSLNNEELLSIRNSIHRILDNRLTAIKDEYATLQQGIQSINITSICDDETIMGSF